MTKRYFSRGLCLFLTVTIISLNYGCGTKRQALSINTHLDLYSKKIALVPSRLPINSNLDVPASGWREGVVFGAGQGALDTTEYFAKGGTCEGEFCGFVALLYLSALVVGVTIGSIYGAVTTPSAESVKEIEVGLAGKTEGALNQLTFAGLLEKKISQNASIAIEMVPLTSDVNGLNGTDYEVLKIRGFQELISANLTDIEFVAGKGKNPPLTMTLNAVVEIVNLNNNEEKISKSYRYIGPQANYSEWMTKDAVELKSYLDLGIQELIESIYHDVFVAFDLPISSGYWDFPGSGKLYGCCWICPENPPLDYSFWGMQLRYPQVESLRPALKWSSFPDQSQAEQFFQATGKSINEVHYDLKIWQGYGDNVFQVNNIPENYYSVEDELEPQTNYFWSIRACFEIDEKRICTSWSKSTVPAIPDMATLGGHVPYCDLPSSIHNFYRFRTP